MTRKEFQRICIPGGVGIFDAKNKIPKKCIDGIQKAFDKKCVGLDHAALFPPNSTPSDLEQAVECEACRALRWIHGLVLDCDLFDDGEDNASCGPELGWHKCDLGVDPNGALELDIVTQAFTVPGNVSGAIDIHCGEVGHDGKAPCTCEIQQLNPFNLASVGFVCLSPGGPGCNPGEIDCDGGNVLDIDLVSDHNIGTCTSNADCSTQCDAYCALSGKLQDGAACEGFCGGGANADNPCTVDTDCPGGACGGVDGPAHGNICNCQCVAWVGEPSRPGGLKCELSTAIDIEVAAPCDGTDVLVAIGQACIHITTETANSIILNANNTPAKNLPPGGASLLGVPTNCAVLQDSVTTGVELVGNVNFFDSLIGDINAQLRLNCQ